MRARRGAAEFVAGQLWAPALPWFDELTTGEKGATGLEETAPRPPPSS
jgi:hypothetical protein